MDDIRRVIDAAGRRLLVNDWLARLVVTLTVVAALAFAARVAQKLVPFGIAWGLALAAGVGVAVVAAAVWAFAARRREIEIAQHVDERAGLRESLSTALAVAREPDGWSRNVVESAGERARRVVVRDTVPITAPRLWAVPAAVGLGLLAVWWLPNYDVTGLFERQAAVAEQERQVQEVRAQAEAVEDKIAELMSKAGMEVREDGETAEPQDAIDPDAPVSPEEVRREAIKKLTNLADQLDEKINESEEAEALEAINDAMRRMRTPADGPASEMGKQMARGNYEQAQQELEKLAEQIASGEMSEEDKQKAAENLRAMQKQLEELASQRERLEEQLQQAGYSAEEAQRMAQDPSQMQRELAQNQEMSAEQKQQLQQTAQAQQRASDAMNAAAQAMGQMAQGLQDPSQAGEAMDGAQAMSQQLSQMEMAQAEMDAARAAMGECQAQLAQMGQGMCENPGMGQGQGFGQGMNQAWRMGESSGMGSGSGGPGRGNGVGPQEQATDYVLRKEKANVNTGEGPVIASTLVYGSQIRGESRATFSNVASAARAEAAEAIEHSRVPRRHEAAVQHYFGRLERAAQGGDAGAGAEEAGSGEGQGASGS